MLGPPSSGKTLVVRQLCQRYKLHHILIQEVIDEAITKMVRFSRFLSSIGLPSRTEKYRFYVAVNRSISPSRRSERVILQGLVVTKGG